jgi:plasmid stabilization system protein ParE
MSLRVQRSDWFIGDLEHYAAWYDREVGWGIAERYLEAVATALARLAENPTLGHVTDFDAWN